MNEESIRQWFDVFKDNEQLTEIRCKSNGKVYSGYFDDIETLLNAIRPFDNYNLYFTLNAINDSAESKPQRNCMMPNCSTTSDNDIVARDWVLVDFDVKRMTDTNSTDEEKQVAYNVCMKCKQYLSDLGFYPPIVADSANGYHLLYKVGMLNTLEHTEIIKKFLQVLKMYFSDNVIDVDSSVYNPARICKLYGTYSRKGNKISKTRPQRISKIVEVPYEVKVTDKGYFEKVANMLPKQETPNRNNNYNTRFDLNEFIRNNGIRVKQTIDSGGITKYVLEECPFDSSHKAPDSAIFQMPSGAIAFKCFHNSCQHYTWKDLRRKFDSSYQQYDKFSKPQYKPPTPLPKINQEEQDKPFWLKASEIRKDDKEPEVFLPSLIPDLDRRIQGFVKGHVSVWTGYAGCGKSSLLNQLILNSAQQGFKTALWTGELSASEEQRWLYQQAAGKNWVEPTRNPDFYRVSPKVSEYIDKWIDKYFILANNDYGNDYAMIEKNVLELYDSEPVDVIILDNLMALDINTLADKINEQQTQLVWSLHRLAIKLQIHIHIVCHPNKGGTYLRVRDISGSGNITNVAQNVFILNRVGLDFRHDVKDYLDKRTIADIEDSGCTNTLEIAKCRSNGKAVGHVVKLYFERESNRLKNDRYEHICYNWQEESGCYDTPQNPYITDDVVTEDIPF